MQLFVRHIRVIKFHLGPEILPKIKTELQTIENTSSGGNCSFREQTLLHPFFKPYFPKALPQISRGFQSWSLQPVTHSCLRERFLIQVSNILVNIEHFPILFLKLYFSSDLHNCIVCITSLENITGGFMDCELGPSYGHIILPSPH